MAKASMYSIIAALLIAAHYTAAFPSDIHYKMSNVEKLAIFDSEDPDPEYDVFPMSLPGMRLIWETKEAIKCTLNINGNEINLNLKPTARYLATKYIPVWSAFSDQHAYKNINYKPLPTAMSDVGDFIMYQDLKNSASLVVYTDRDQKIVVEGFITSRYAIKSLPQRFTGELLNEIDDITDIPDMMGGAITSNKETDFYAIITNPETSVPPTIDSSLEIDESIEPTERESHVSHDEERTTLVATPRHLDYHETTEPNGPVINDESKNHEGVTHTSADVFVSLEHHETTEADGLVIEDETENHEGVTNTPAVVSIILEHHETTEADGPVIDDESENHEVVTNTPAVVSIILEHHETTEADGPVIDDESENHEGVTDTPADVSITHEQYETTYPNGPVIDDESENHEGVTDTPADVSITHEQYETTYPNGPVIDDESDNHQEVTNTPADVSITYEHHDSTYPNGPVIDGESENHQEVTNTPADVSITHEHHETTYPNGPVIDDESENDQEVTNTPTDVSITYEHHDSTYTNGPVIDDETENHEGGLTASAVHTPPEHPESANPTGPTVISEIIMVNGVPVHNERKKRYAQKKLYPEMLIVLDHNALRHRTMTEALRLTLAFWNAVDLIYREFDDPKIRLNIAGIIVAVDNTATPYIAKNTSVPGIGDLNRVSSKIGKYFYKERVRFPTNQYDIIIAMTTMNLCAGKIDSCDSSESIHGYVNGLPICSSGQSVTKTLNNVMIVHNNGIFGPEHSFFAQYEPQIERNSCIHDDCSDKLLPVFLLASTETQCLRNKPLSIKPVDEILPGRWLSMDGQCHNEGYAESCNYKRKIGKCVTKGCRDKHTMKCVRSEEIPLPGSKCGTAKYCNKHKKCVYKL